MECACTVELDLDSDGEHCELIDVNDHAIAFWECECDECRRTFSIGDRHMLEQFYVGRYHVTHRTCYDCKSLRHVFFHAYYYGQLWSDFQEFLENCRGDVSVSCLRMLTPWARGKALDMIEEIYEDINEQE